MYLIPWLIQFFIFIYYIYYYSKLFQNKIKALKNNFAKVLIKTFNMFIHLMILHQLLVILLIQRGYFFLLDFKKLLYLYSLNNVFLNGDYIYYSLLRCS